MDHHEKKIKRQNRAQKRKKQLDGFVTVFVTILLIPALLISGTAVDLARIYTAKSMLENGNHLAASSMLTNYNSLLQDMYGLYGVIDDETLKSLVTEYVNYALYGEDSVAKLGTLESFYGSTECVVTVTSGEGHNLGNLQIMRRQIEEYAKFRAPVAVVDRLMNFLDVVETLDEDQEIIADKTEIDESVEELYEIYEEIYTLIQHIDTYKAAQSTAVSTFNTYLREIWVQLCYLDGHFDKFNPLAEEDERYEYEQRYEEIIREIADIARIKLEPARDTALSRNQGYETMFAQLESLCQSADQQKKVIEQKVANLKYDLDGGKGNEELNKGLSELIPNYENLMSYNLQSLAKEFTNKNRDVLDGMSVFLQTLGFYGNYYIYLQFNFDYSVDLTINQLKDPSMLFSYNDDASNARLDELLYAAEGYHIGSEFYENFKTFQECSTDHSTFYQELNALFSSASSSKEEAEKEKGKVSNLLGAIQKVYNDAVVFDPEGQPFLPTGSGTSSFPFESASGWGDEDGFSASSFLSSLTKLGGNFLGSMADKTLLVVYDLEMFSDYVTNRSPEDVYGEASTSVTKSMAGIPINKTNNYLYQSEVEYLFNGNATAVENLKAVYGIMYTIRLVLNYSASFTIPSVVSVVSGLYAIPLVGWAIGESARFAIAMGETLLDMAQLRTGGRVAIFKTPDTWQLSVEGLLSKGADEIQAELTKTTSSTPGGLSYSDYLTLLLLFIDGDTLAKRTSDLIQANINWYKDGKQDGKGSLGTSFDLSQAKTDFEIESTVDIKMLFLSMPLAQGFSSDTSPSSTFTITAKANRGF